VENKDLFKRYIDLESQAKKLYILFEDTSPSELLPLAEKLGADTSTFLQEGNIGWGCCGNLGRHLTFLVRYLKKGEKKSCLQDINDIVFFDLPRLSNYISSFLDKNHEINAITTQRRHPQIFISYSHSINEHKQWVLQLGEKLRWQGVDVILDQWDLRHGDDIATFMERSIAMADRVLVICSETYNKKVAHNTGGVAYEKLLVTAELVKKVGSNKFIPIVPPTDHINSYGIPTFLSGRLHIDFSRDHELNTQEFLKLVKELHGLPLLEKPPLGPIPFSPGG